MGIRIPTSEDESDSRLIITWRLTESPGATNQVVEGLARPPRRGAMRRAAEAGREASLPILFTGGGFT